MVCLCFREERKLMVLHMCCRFFTNPTFIVGKFLHNNPDFWLCWSEDQQFHSSCLTAGATDQQTHEKVQQSWSSSPGSRSTFLYWTHHSSSLVVL